MRRSKMRRLVAHDEDFEFAPAFKINAMRRHMTGKDEEYFDIWVADRGTTDAAKSYEKLLSKVRDYAIRRGLDRAVIEKMQHGVDPVDVGTTRGWSWWRYSG